MLSLITLPGIARVDFSLKVLQKRQLLTFLGFGMNLRNEKKSGVQFRQFEVFEHPNSTCFGKLKLPPFLEQNSSKKWVTLVFNCQNISSISY